MAGKIELNSIITSTYGNSSPFVIDAFLIPLGIYHSLTEMDAGTTSR